MSIFAGMEPQAPLKFFEAVSAVPRGSNNEKGIALWLKAFADERGLGCYVDEHWNVLIKKPGQHGGESAAPLMLQGHSDIVCEKNKDTEFDFEKDGLRLLIDGDILRADGTTLGNDDGYAMAYMLAVLDDQTIPHPPLECMFTAMEEIGLIGAQLFDYSHISARRLIGMDGAGEGMFMIGSAGGMQVSITAPADREAYSGAALAIRVRGLQGGHSGGRIHEGLGNANRILGRILRAVAGEVDIRLASIAGGDKDNAIPRESDAVIILDNSKIEAAKSIVASVTRDIQAELAYADKGFFTETEAVTADSCLTAACSARCLALQHVLPSGVVTMSRAIPGLVEASRNFASVKEADGTMQYIVSVRSATDSLVLAVADEVCHLAQALGAETALSAHYPAYSYNPDSPLRAQTAALWQRETGSEPVLQASHGGTELGVFSKNLPGLDIVTLGPTSGGAHTPEEWVDLQSFGRVYRFLLKLLAQLAK